MSGPVSDHYNSVDLLSRIERAIGEIGRTPDTVTIEEIAPLEDFHIGGRAATAALQPRLELTEAMRARDLAAAQAGPHAMARTAIAARWTGSTSP